MSQDSVSGLIAKAWEQHRNNSNDAALAMFDDVLAQDDQNVDAYYGKGLALRDLKRQDDAIDSLKTAYDLATKFLDDLREEHKKDGMHLANKLNMTDDDRYMMLIRMIGQRLQELGVDMNVSTF
jgi:tetratricopeptide (TPR) repeat protein